MKRAASRAKFLALSLAAVACSSFANRSNGEEMIPEWSIELERRAQPWCPGDCQWAVPFTATYRQRDQVLVFVGVRHAFTASNPTTRAVDAGFTILAPAIVVVEGLPSRMGENPTPIIQQLRSTDAAEDSFTKGEGAYAIRKALARNVPFIGGEPTRAEQVQWLTARGFAQEDIAFSYLVGGLSQSMRAGDLAGVSDPRLSRAFDDWAAAFSAQFGLTPLPLEKFRDKYRTVYGVELSSEIDPIARIEGVTQPPLMERLRANDMITRDEHLLSLIERLLATRKKVLVIYGGSHWTTLSAALEKRLGKPVIEPFLK